MSCVLVFLKGTTIQVGTDLFAGTLPGCPAGAETGGQ